jgi:hypothetical protein
MLVRKAFIQILHQIIHTSFKAEAAFDMLKYSFEVGDRGLLYELPRWMHTRWRDAFAPDRVQ